MHGRAATIFYSLLGFVLLTAFFVMQPDRNPQISALQTQMEQQFVVAWKQTIGDQPWFTELPVMYQGINAFYTQAADSSLALLEDKQADADIAYVWKTTYQIF